MTSLTRIRVFRSPDFNRYFLASMVSITGSSLTGVALPLAVFDETSSARLTALIVVMQVAPFLLFGLVAGAIADRADRRRLMVACNIVSGVALLALVASVSVGAPLVPAALLATLVTQVSFVFFGAADFAAVPALVGRSQVVEAQSALSSTTTLLGLVVPAAGAALYGLTGPLPLFALDSVTFLYSAFMLARIQCGFLTVSQESGRRRLAREILDGLRFLWHERVVRALTFIGTFNAMAGGAVDAMLVVFAGRAFGIVPDDSIIGLFFLGGSVGSLTGALALPWLRRRHAALNVTMLLLVGSALAALVLAVAPVAPVAIATFAVWRATYGMTITNGITVRMQLLPDEYQSRVGNTARLIALSGSPVGAIVAGFLADSINIRYVLVLATIPLLFGVALALVFRHSKGWQAVPASNE